MPNLTLLAPLDGWSLPLGDVPDPVFADRLAGDGLAIDPTSNVVCAPCAGEIIFPPRAQHALSIRSDAGVTVMIHVGIDTVALDGAGFERLVGAATRVRPGDPLLRFDLDAIARRARSAITPIVFGVESGAAITVLAARRSVRVGDPLLAWGVAAERDLRAPVAAAAAAAGLRRTLRVPFDHGLHARPAAMIAAAVKSLRVDARAEANGRSADLRSVTGLMSLGLQRGDPVLVILDGAGAGAALAALEGLLTATGAPPAPPSPPPPHAEPLARGAAPLLRGGVAARGIAVGTAVTLVTT